jgi:acetyltransferase
MPEPDPGRSEAFTLRGGTTVTVRPIRPDDAPRLQSLFDRLSPQSIYLRFLGPRRTLTRERAERLANVDYQTRMALVASLEEGGRETIIAVARYAAFAGGDPDVVEASIVVEDRFQRQGLGGHMLERLAAYAQSHGIRAFVAAIHRRNTHVLRFVKRSSYPSKRRMRSGVWEVEVLLEPGAGAQE